MEKGNLYLLEVGTLVDDAKAFARDAYTPNALGCAFDEQDMTVFFESECEKAVAEANTYVKNGGDGAYALVVYEGEHGYDPEMFDCKTPPDDFVYKPERVLYSVAKIGGKTEVGFMSEGQGIETILYPEQAKARFKELECHPVYCTELTAFDSGGGIILAEMPLGDDELPEEYRGIPAFLCLDSDECLTVFINRTMDQNGDEIPYDEYCMLFSLNVHCRVPARLKKAARCLMDKKCAYHDNGGYEDACRLEYNGELAYYDYFENFGPIPDEEPFTEPTRSSYITLTDTSGKTDGKAVTLRLNGMFLTEEIKALIRIAIARATSRSGWNLEDCIKSIESILSAKGTVEAVKPDYEFEVHK